MVGRLAYDLMYRWWAPWDAVGVAGVRSRCRFVEADLTTDDRSLVGDHFDIASFTDTGLPDTACFLLTRRATPELGTSGGAS
jgi:hypothetical protein